MPDALDGAGRLVREIADTPTGELSPSDVQTLVAVAARAYASACERGHAGDPVAPGAINATEAVTLCRGLMAAADIELFELSMWGAIQPAETKGRPDGRR